MLPSVQATEEQLGFPPFYLQLFMAVQHMRECQAFNQPGAQIFSRTVSFACLQVPCGRFIRVQLRTPFVTVTRAPSCDETSRMGATLVVAEGYENVPVYLMSLNFVDNIRVEGAGVVVDLSTPRISNVTARSGKTNSTVDPNLWDLDVIHCIKEAHTPQDFSECARQLDEKRRLSEHRVYTSVGAIVLVVLVCVLVATICVRRTPTMNKNAPVKQKKN